MSILRCLALLLALPACTGEKSDDDADDTTPGDDGGDEGADGGDGSDGDDGGSDGGDDAEGHYFPAGARWTEDISSAPTDPASDSIIAFLQDHGWGLGRFQIDFSIEVLQANASTPRMNFEPTYDFFEPDCDLLPVPIPEGGALEGEDGYACESDGDCHLIVHEVDEQVLHEMWRANIDEGVFYGGCLAAWDLSRIYGPEGRGEQCTSADAAGYPIAPLLFSADEVAAGEIAHAIRFILPNSAIRADEYVHPATHSTGAASGPATAPPYGAHLRLRADFPIDSLPTEGAKVVARALQRYGMYLADGGNVALTAQSDRFTEARWEGLLGSRDLEEIEPRDFEVLELGTPIPLTYDCERAD